jgi:hypothetical protein
MLSELADKTKQQEQSESNTYISYYIFIGLLFLFIIYIYELDIICYNYLKQLINNDNNIPSYWIQVNKIIKKN